MNLTMTMTERDKKLLYFVGLALFLYLFFQFAFFPALEARDAAQADLADTEEAQTVMSMDIARQPAAEADVQAAFQDRSAAAAPYYGLLSSDELDTLVTTLMLNHNLFPLSLTIGDREAQSMTGYSSSLLSGSKAAPAVHDASQDPLNQILGSLQPRSWSGVQLNTDYLQCAAVSFTASGDRTDFVLLLDDLAQNYPSIHLSSFQITDTAYSGTAGEVQSSSTFSCSLLIFMCDKERDLY